jgi:hypothetical protein
MISKALTFLVGVLLLAIYDVECTLESLTSKHAGFLSIFFENNNNPILLCNLAAEQYVFKGVLPIPPKCDLSGTCNITFLTTPLYVSNARIARK